MVCADARVVDVEEPSDVNKALDVENALDLKEKVDVDQGGVDVDGGGFGEGGMESTLAMSEDEPSLREALSGDEHAAWVDAIEAKLGQMEKVNAWILVIPPKDANIIPS